MRVAAVATLALALSLGLGLSVGAEAKKKSGKVKTFRATKGVNAPIPDGALDARSTPLLSTISVPKKYKGKVVGDVNVTGIQTTGSEAGAANDLFASLIAPNGRTIDLFVGVGDQSLGPWTIDDDTSTAICPLAAPAQCPDSTRTLSPPFAGRSNTVFNFNGSFPTNGPLATFNGLKMKGTWTLLVADLGPPGVDNGTSALNGWGLVIAPAKPVSN
jgi:hypothetical protein